MGGKSAPKPPDLTPLSNAQLEISKAQLAQAQQQMGISQQEFSQYMDLNKQQLQQSQDQYTQQMDIQQKALQQASDANAVSKQVADTQMASMNQSMQYAQQDRDRYTNTILPLQDQYIQEAKDYSSPAKQATAAGQALADNQTQLEAQRSNQMAQLEAMGVDPSQVMSTSLSSQLGVAGAAQGAMAANTARQNVINTGYNMLGNAINMGNNLPSQAISETGQATNSGNSASGNMQSGVNGYNSASQIGATASGIRQNSLNLSTNLTGSPMSWAQLGNQSFGGASNGIMNASSIINQGYQNQLSQFNANQNSANSMMSGIGSIASIAGMAMMAEGGPVANPTTSTNYAGAGYDDSLLQDTRGLSTGAMDSNASGYDSSMFANQGDNSMSLPSGAPLSSANVTAPRSSLFNNPKVGKGLQMAGAALQAQGARQVSTQGQTFLHPIYRAEGGVMGPGGTATGQYGQPRAMPTMASRDQIHAMLAPGEYVIPADVVHQLGVSHFDKLVQKHHRPGA